ncbi:MAG: hypothetical protein WBH56_04620, partial [Bacteroidota bacterium]
LGPNVYEYPLFGEGLTRNLTPVSSFRTGLKSIPEDAGYLLFIPDYIVPRETDELLGNRWYLRRLPPAGDIRPQRE